MTTLIAAGALRPPGPTRSSRRRWAAALVVAVGLPLALTWAHLARWTTFDCDSTSCTYTSRRLLTFPWVHQRIAPRLEIASRPHAIEVQVIDANRRSCDLVIEVDGERMRVAQGGEGEITERAAELRRDLADPATPVHASVSPHPFGFVALGVLALLLLAAAREVTRARSSRRGVVARKPASRTTP